MSATTSADGTTRTTTTETPQRRRHTREEEEEAQGRFVSAFCDEILRDAHALADGAHELELTTTYLQLLNRAFSSLTSRLSQRRASLSSGTSGGLAPSASRVSAAREAAARVTRFHLRHDGVSQTFRGDVDLAELFGGVRQLRLSRVKPTSVNDLRALSRRLVTLKVFESLCSIRELLDVSWGPPPEATEEKDAAVVKQRAKGSLAAALDECVMPFLDATLRMLKEEGCWGRLEGLSIEGNFVPEMDESLHLLARCCRLNCNGNLVRQIGNLQSMYRLTWLDLSNNKLVSLESCYLYMGNIKCLVLRGNFVKSTRGLERLFGLEDLDLGSNRIEDLAEVGRLAALPLLHGLWLDDNPIVAASGERYRKKVLCAMAERLRDSDFSLDGEPATHEEITDALANPLFVTSVAIKRPAEQPRYSQPNSPSSPLSSMERDHMVSTSVQTRKKRKRKVVVLNSGALGPAGGTTDGIEESDERLSQSVAAASAIQWREKLEEIKTMAGDKWLLVVDELRPPAEAASMPSSPTGNSSVGGSVSSPRALGSPKRHSRRLGAPIQSPREQPQPSTLMTETVISPPTMSSVVEGQSPARCVSSGVISTSPCPPICVSGSVPAHVCKQQVPPLQLVPPAVAAVPPVVIRALTTTPALPDPAGFQSCSLPSLPPKPLSPPPSPLQLKGLAQPLSSAPTVPPSPRQVVPPSPNPPKSPRQRPVVPPSPVPPRSPRQRPGTAPSLAPPLGPPPLPPQPQQPPPSPVKPRQLLFLTDEAQQPPQAKAQSPKSRDVFSAVLLGSQQKVSCAVRIAEDALTVCNASSNQLVLMSNLRDISTLARDPSDPTVVQLTFSPRGATPTSADRARCTLKMEDLASAERFAHAVEHFVRSVTPDSCSSLSRSCIESSGAQPMLECLNCGEHTEAGPSGVKPHCPACGKAFLVAMAQPSASFTAGTSSASGLAASVIEGEKKKRDALVMSHMIFEEYKCPPRGAGSCSHAAESVGASATAKGDKIAPTTADEHLNREMMENASAQCWFRSTVFKGASEEDFLRAVTCGAFKFGTTETELRNVVCILSTDNAYLVAAQRPILEASDLFSGANVIATVDLGKLTCVIAGPSLHYVRLEQATASGSSWVLMTRCHAKTHPFVEAVVSAARAKQQGGDKCTLVHATRATWHGFLTAVLKSNKGSSAPQPQEIPKQVCGVALYCQLFEKSGSQRLLARTLIATEEELFICTEDLARWPLPVQSTEASSAPATPHVVILKRADIADITQIVLHGGVSAPHSFSLILEQKARTTTGKRRRPVTMLLPSSASSAKAKLPEWTLVPENPEECLRVFQVIQRLYKQLTKILAVCTNE